MQIMSISIKLLPLTMERFSSTVFGNPKSAARPLAEPAGIIPKITSTCSNASAANLIVPSPPTIKIRSGTCAKYNCCKADISSLPVVSNNISSILLSMANNAIFSIISVLSTSPDMGFTTNIYLF